MREFNKWLNNMESELNKNGDKDKEKECAKEHPKTKGKSSGRTIPHPPDETLRKYAQQFVRDMIGRQKNGK